MKSLLLMLFLCLSTVHSESTNKTSPSKDKENQQPWYETQDYSYSVALDVRLNRTTIKQCGGAQIGLEWVITAAECLPDTEWTAIVITCSNGMQQYRHNFFLRKIVRFAIHPDYDPNTKAHNLAVVKCHYCGTLRKTLIPTVPLEYQHKYSFSQKPAVVTAVQNVVHEKKVYGIFIKSIKTHVVEPFWCKVAHFFSVGDHICASRLAGRLQSAEIGAPLVIEGHLLGLVQIVGVGTSISHWPNWIPVPMVFTRIEPYSDWIRNVTGIK